jgi:hypothetical protein
VLGRPDAGWGGFDRRGARIGPVATKNSRRETDLGPRRVGIHFRKPACRSDAVDEVLTDGGVNGLDFGARARSTGPPHEGEPAPPGAGSCPRSSALLAGAAGVSGVRTSKTEPERTVTNTWGFVLARRPNKAMKLTRGGWCGSDVGARQSSRRTVVIVRGPGRSRPSQLIAGVRRGSRVGRGRMGRA